MEHTARIVDTPDGQVVVLPKDVAFAPSVKLVEVERIGDKIMLREPRKYMSGSELADYLGQFPPLPRGERLPVDIPDRS